MRLLGILTALCAVANAQYALQSTFAGETFFNNFVSIQNLPDNSTEKLLNLSRSSIVLGIPLSGVRSCISCM
jgi:hypothetical protein